MVLYCTKQFPAVNQPGADLLNEQSVVLHVLEHLNADDPVKCFLVFVWEIEHSDIASENSNIVQTSFL